MIRGWTLMYTVEKVMGYFGLAMVFLGVNFWLRICTMSTIYSGSIVFNDRVIISFLLFMRVWDGAYWYHIMAGLSCELWMGIWFGKSTRIGNKISSDGNVIWYMGIRENGNEKPIAANFYFLVSSSSADEPACWHLMALALLE